MDNFFRDTRTSLSDEKGHSMSQLSSVAISIPEPYRTPIPA
jgi:hypothetical protein